MQPLTGLRSPREQMPNLSGERNELLISKARADLEAARAALELERYDLKGERDWLERRIDEERARIERG